MTLLYFVLLLLALVCFVAAAFKFVAARVDLVALGLAFAFAVPFIQTLQKL